MASSLLALIDDIATILDDVALLTKVAAKKTAGMLITAIDFLRVNRAPTEEEVRDAMSAVLCRCTGYQGIVAAVMAVAHGSTATNAA